MKDGDIISFNGVVYKYCTGGTCLQCSLRNTRLCDHLKCFNGEHFEVLEGADVVEMPGEEEIEQLTPRGRSVDVCNIIDLFKSKIVK